MKLHRKLTWLVLLLMTAAVASGAVVGQGGRYPSPYVDDWSDVDLRGGANDCGPAVAACLAASGVAIFRDGVYSLNTSGSVGVSMADGDRLQGAGMGQTILRLEDNDTGAGLLLGSDCVVADLTIDAFDDASTLGARLTSSKHRATYLRVEFSDLATGCQDGSAAVNGIQLVGCRFTSCTTGFSTSAASTGITITGGASSGNTTAISLGNAPTGVLIQGHQFGSPDANTTAISLSTASQVVIRGNDFVAGTTSINPGTGSRNEVGENRWGFDETTTADVAGLQILLRGKYYASGSPTTRSWLTGEWVYNEGPSSSEAIGWVCTSGGTAGTWTAGPAIP